MRYGVSFPLGVAMDTTVARDLAQTYDESGFDFVGMAGHLLSAESGRYADRPPMTYAGDFHEPFAFFSYLAAHTQQLKFRTGILIMPLYNTAVVANAAAEVAILSNNRLELGVGISWNPDEYTAAGVDFTHRGRILEEQLILLRQLWTEPFVTFSGRYHHFDQMGLGNRLPDRPIPLWIGSSYETRPMERAARLGDGWMPMGEPPAEVLDHFWSVLEANDRERAGFGLTLRLSAGPEGPSAWVEEAKRLQGIGATHLTLAAPMELQGQEALDRVLEAKRVLSEEVG
jgi:probable F420-dependent oxidoreductase